MMQVFDEDLDVFDYVVPAWPAEVNEVADFDSETDVDGDLNNAPAAAHDGSNGLEVTFDNATSAYGTMNAAAVNQETGVKSFWIDKHDVAIEDGKILYLAGFYDGGNALRWALRFGNNGGTYQVRMTYSDDGGTERSAGAWYTLPADWNNIKIMLKRSTGAGNDDGWMKLYLGDALVVTSTGHDNDTRDWDYTRTGMVWTNSTTFGGSFYLDTIKVSPTGGVLLDKLAAKNGTYGISIATWGTSNSYGRCIFGGTLTEKAAMAECQFDPNGLDMGTSEQFILMSADQDTEWELHCRYDNGEYKVILRAHEAFGSQATTLHALVNDWNRIRVYWVAASGTGKADGWAQLLIGEDVVETLAGLDNDTVITSSVKFGIVGDIGDICGIVHLDDCKWSPVWQGQDEGQLGWAINVDWDGDGVYDGFNEAPYCIDYQLTRGRQFFLAKTGGGFESFQPGRLTITLLNTDGRYDPHNADGPLYPDIDKGKFIKVQVYHDWIIYDRFAGIIENIQPSRQNGLEVVTVTALGGWAWLQEYFTTAAVETTKATEDAITDILSDADWPTIWGTAIDAGAEDIPYWWEDYRTAAEAIKDITDFENARFWIGADGKANFESRQTTGSFSIELTEAELLKEISLEMPWDAERNIVRIVGHPIKDEGIQTIWTLEDTPQVAAGEPFDIIVDFTYNDKECAAHTLITPVITTDYLMNSQSDGGGANHSANFTVSILYTWGQRAKLRFANGGGSASYITLGKLRANALTWPNEVSFDEDRRVGTEQPRYFVIDSKHIQNSTNVPVLADYYADYITMTKLFPTVRLENRFVKQFTPEILQRIGLNIPTKGVEDKSYRLGYIEERWLHPTGQAVETIFKFEPMEELGTYWTFPAQMGIDTIFIY